MKALLVAINAKYIHSSLGIYSLYSYSVSKGISPQELSCLEFTINQPLEDMMGNIYEEKPDLIGFSCYIWNIELVRKLSVELRKLLPECMIWYGGPEAGYDGEKMLRENICADGIMLGEGEKSFYEILCCFRQDGRKGEYEQIDGLAIRRGGEILITPKRECEVLDEIVFPYQDMGALEHRIVYYETSRGCPYGCSYCLSSVEKKVRFRSMSLVEKELQFFLDRNVPQVKFVDRTFNCNSEHTMAIWRYIYEHDNGVTNFHFELSAELLTEEEITFVRSFRPGLVQFEIGVQSTNPKTLEAICRVSNLEKLRNKVAAIREGRNIHQHLDLIAGLPYEDMNSFRQSFNDVYAMKPDQLQVGFLKVLKGSSLEAQVEAFGIVPQSVPPYEVLYTKWLSYDEIRELKLVEDMVERYYNSMQFQASVLWLVQYFSDAFSFYDALGKYFQEKGYSGIQQSRLQNYEILYCFAKERQLDTELLKELLLFDLYARENLKKEPAFLQGRVLDDGKKEWLRKFYQNEVVREHYLPHYRAYSWKQLLRMTHVEWFTYDIPVFLQTGNLVKGETVVLFDYEKRNPLDYQAAYYKITED